MVDGGSGPGELPSPAAGGTGPRRRLARRLLLPLWILIATAVVLEGVLQAGAGVVWAMERQPAPPPPPATGQSVVLCVGDSWTHGMGSSDPAAHGYPAVLQSLLQKSGQPWRVVNGGQSGQNSRDVLQRLPSQLAEFRPAIVCVLVGFNDFWSTPAELPGGSTTAELGHDAYRFRWRLPRLLAWIGASLRGAPQLGEPVAPVVRGPEWAPRTVTVPNPYGNEPRKGRATDASRAHQDAGWRCEAAGDLRGALQAFEQAIAADPDDALTREMLVRLHQKEGRSAEVAVHLDWLAAQWARDRDYWSGRSLTRALGAIGRSQEAVELAVAMLQRFPKDASIWRTRAECEFQLGLHAAASASIDESIRLGADPWAFFWRYKIHHMGLSDTEEGMRTIFRAYVMFNDAARAAQDLRACAALGAAPRLRPVLAAFPCEPDVRDRLGTIVDEVLVSLNGAEASRVLSAHLRRIAIAVRNAGAMPVFLTYPVQQTGEDELRAVAQDLGVHFVPVRERFQQRLGTRTWNDVKAPDGHCNDEGYRMMAEIVAAGLGDLAAARSR